MFPALVPGFRYIASISSIKCDINLYWHKRPLMNKRIIKTCEKSAKKLGLHLKIINVFDDLKKKKQGLVPLLLYQGVPPIVFSKNIASVRNCPDVTLLNFLFGPCILSFCLFIFLSFCIFVFLNIFSCIFFCLFFCSYVFLSFFLFFFCLFCLDTMLIICLKGLKFQKSLFVSKF